VGFEGHNTSKRLSKEDVWWSQQTPYRVPLGERGTPLIPLSPQEVPGSGLSLIVKVAGMRIARREADPKAMPYRLARRNRCPSRD